jgi:hypothetical protein
VFLQTRSLQETKASDVNIMRPEGPATTDVLPEGATGGHVRSKRVASLSDTHTDSF